MEQSPGHPRLPLPIVIVVLAGGAAILTLQAGRHHGGEDRLGLLELARCVSLVSWTRYTSLLVTRRLTVRLPVPLRLLAVLSALQIYRQTNVFLQIFLLKL